jgi:hypothetical protein
VRLTALIAGGLSPTQATESAARAAARQRALPVRLVGRVSPGETCGLLILPPWEEKLHPKAIATVDRLEGSGWFDHPGVMAGG